MRTRIVIGIGLILVGSASSVYSQDVVWRAAKPAPGNSAISLGQPSPLSAPDSPEPPPRVVRGQIGDAPPPPPAFPGSGAAPVFPGASGPQMYNQGVVNRDGDLGGFWSRVGDQFQRCWEDVSGGVNGAVQGKRPLFQSDRSFEVFSSPVTNPFFFEDPRSLTELRPIFMWQHTPSSNPVYSGGNNFVYTLAGSVAFTEHISLVLNRLGFDTIDPRTGTPTIQPHTGFDEILLGPKLTFLRNETSNTVAAVGLTFDIPTGSGNVLQNTGHLALIPYFSIAQNFGRSDYGSVNFMNTTGYTFRTDNTRTESFYSSFHFDYNVKNLNRFFPLIEMNWRHYTRNGGAQAINFEGSDVTNYGSQFVSGQNELTLALGTRIVINRYVQWGIAAEFNVLNNSAGNHLDQFRLTTDFIFRY